MSQASAMLSMGRVASMMSPSHGASHRKDRKPEGNPTAKVVATANCWRGYRLSELRVYGRVEGSGLKIWI